MMMCLGQFIFSLPTLAYQQLDRQTAWKHVANPRVGARDAQQFTGIGDDIITLTGWLAPELIGSPISLDILRAMADTGKSWILIKGTGRICGTYLITSVQEKHSILGSDGHPAKIDFTVSLKRTDEETIAQQGGLGDIGAIADLIRSTP